MASKKFSFVCISLFLAPCVLPACGSHLDGGDLAPPHEGVSTGNPAHQAPVVGASADAAPDAGATEAGGVTGSSCPAGIWCTRAPAMTATNFRATWSAPFAIGVPSSNVWAATDAGTIFRSDGITWQTAYEPDDNVTATALWGTSDSDVWASFLERAENVDWESPAYPARRTKLLHWNGAAWSTPTWLDGELWTLWGARSDDMWAAGRNGLMAHFDGRAWAWDTRLPASFSSSIVDVHGRRSDDAWAIAADASVLHWNGTVWSKVDLGAAALGSNVHATPAGIWETDQGAVYVVRDEWTYSPSFQGQFVVGRLWNGVWTTSTQPVATAGRSIAASERPGRRMWGSADYLWVADRLFPATWSVPLNGYASAWTAHTSPQDREINAFAGGGSVGTGAEIAFGDRGAVAMLDSQASWLHEARSARSHLMVLSAVGTDDVWALREIDHGDHTNYAHSTGRDVSHWNGSFWSGVRLFNTGIANDLSAFARDSVWAVGHGAYQEPPVYRWDGSAWSAVSAPFTNGLAVWAGGPSDVWVTATDGLYRFDGHAWTKMRDIAGVEPGYLQRIGGSGPDDVWFSVETYAEASVGRQLLHWDGKAFTDHGEGLTGAPGISAISTVSSIAASGPRDAWIVERGSHVNPNGGFQQVAYHWNGVTWSIRFPPAGLDLEGAWSRGANDVFFAATRSGRGTVVHFDGVSFAEMPLKPDTVAVGAISGHGSASTGSIYVGGENGLLVESQGALSAPR